jgi:F-type H+-transporting ATPase subunit delta
MRETTIGRNYAEALVALATRAGDLEGWGAMISDVANAVQTDVKLSRFLESPRISADKKSEILARAFQDRLPRLFVRFLQAVIRHRRQALIPAIAGEYHAIVDDVQGRVHAQVAVAREPDPRTRTAIERELARVLRKTVVPHYAVKPYILGGMVVRVGDTVMDGSVRRRLTTLRRHMLSGAVT